jgi:Tol biopolymer transport system component
VRSLVVVALTERVETPLLGAQATSSGPRSLAFQPAMHPLVILTESPSGNRLAFATSTGDERSVLSTIASDGTDQQKILDESASISSPKWSSAADAIYSLRGRWGGGTELWKVTVAADGRASGPATRVLGGLPLGERFSLTRDGTQLAYTRSHAYANLWVVTPSAATASQARVDQLTAGTFSDTRPVISPDGLRVAFSRRAGDRSAVHVMPVDGSAAPLQLTFFANAESPSWSPDGRELALSSNEGGKQRVWTVSAAGGPPRVFGGTEVSVETNVAHSPVSWGPRGTILYHTAREPRLHRTGSRNSARDASRRQ